MGAESCETAGQLAFPWPSLNACQTCGEVSNWLQENPRTAAAILDDDGLIVGLANRLIYLARYARQYAPELYSKKPVMAMASKDPLVVDENVPVSELGATLLMENPNALIECFVVTRRGRY